MATNVNEVLSLDELVDYLKVSKSTLYKLVQRGHLPGKKIVCI
jgi:excisionase family DNA binding protein